MEGRIIAIKAENFMTYNHVEFFPEPNLNVVIGPNGTGKSSLVCAIVLGLKSRPHLLARGSSVSSFVRGHHGSATVELELYKSHGKNYVIKRIINADTGASTWYLNNIPSAVRDVENLVSKLNIQVDNLCQFLPQDRVQDFARMNPQDLLENTIRCVGEQKLLIDWKKLKELRACDKAVQTEIKSMSESIRTKESQNQSIETDVKSLRKRKRLEEQLLTLKQKHAWLVYGEKKSTLDKAEERICLLKNDKSGCDKICGSIEKKREKIMMKMKLLQKKYDREIVLAEDKVHAVRETCNVLSKAEDRVEDARQEMEGRVRMEEERQKEMRKIVSDIADLVSQLEITRKELGERDYSAQVKELSQRNRSKIEEKKLLMQDEQKITSSLQQQSYQAKALECEFNKLSDLNNQRLELLRANYPDAIKAIKWLRENKQRFRYAVFEPMMMLIHPNNINAARFLENIVQRRDLIAFVFEDSKDMSTFLLEMRDVMKLNVNAVQSKTTPLQFEPTVPLCEISSYGFTTYASSLYQTVPAIHNYLCQNYRLHDIPIGNDRTFQMLDDVPPFIHYFFTSDRRISRKASRYSSNISTSVSGLSEPRLLIIQANVNRSSEVERGLKMVRDDLAKLEQKRYMVMQKVLAIEAEQEELLSQKKELESQTSKSTSMEAKLKTMKSMYKRLTEQVQDVDQIRGAFHDRFKTVLSEMNQKYRQMRPAITSAQECWIVSKLTQLEIECLRASATVVENKLRDAQRQQLRAQEVLNQAMVTIANVKADVRSALAEAKLLTDGLIPQDDGFSVFQNTFKRLADDMKVLESEMETIRGKLDCLGGTDNSVLKEFENRRQQIEDLKSQLEEKISSSEQMKGSINSLKGNWLASLNELVEKISRKFSECFATLNCAGEVKLHTGSNEDDFDQYGLRVRVKFRSQDELQDLNKHLQSGGERSVSTAIFMISLQGLTKVPFCCVDEINQGMDKFNERMIFDLLVATTSLPNSPQYFLLTPKLLSGLQYSPTTAVSCVFNGSWIAPILVTQDRREHSKKKPRLS